MMITQGNNAMRMIGFNLRQSGAIELAPLDPGLPVGQRVYNFNDFYTGNGGGAWTPGLIVEGTDGGTNPDTLTLSFENRANAVTRDCLGNTTAVATRVQSTFSVSGSSLQCLGSGNANAQPIADNVEDFQVWYWVQAGTGPTATQIRRTADQVGAAGGWTNVVAVEICLQIRGEFQNVPITGGTYVNCRDVSTPRDNRLRQVFRSTFNLRNQEL
jgi:type IV pilus assembly protein PilW